MNINNNLKFCKFGIQILNFKPYVENIIWYNRMIYNYKRFELGAMSIYDIWKGKLMKKDIFFGYVMNNEYKIFLRAINKIKGNS
jgi:hypothetical protein